MPVDLRAALGVVHVNRSLRTDSPSLAIRLARKAAFEIDAMFEDTRRQIGLEYDARLIVDRESIATVSRTIDRRPPASAKAGAVAVEQDNGAGLTLSGVYERFLADPTKRRSARTMLAHHSTRRVMEEVLGAATPLNQINREACRELLEILRWLPVNVTKKFPRLTVREAAMLAKKDARITTINATNLNAYMSRFTTMLNWAVNEEYLGRNPARGLQWADTVHPQDRRKPFDLWQLQRIFNAPIYMDRSASGEQWASGAKGWIPLLALHSGARLNELAQLDVADVRQVDGVTCIVITEASATGARDKSLKTKSSERIVPVHPVVLDSGFMAFVQDKRRSGAVKLFDDLPLGAKGFWTCNGFAPVT